MAANTAQKRFMMMSLGTPVHLLFEPDGAVDADDRNLLLGGYAFATVYIPTTVPGVEFMLADNRLQFKVKDNRLQFKSTGTD